jgi:transcriptional regulator with XRE-family HTH domain
VIRGERVRLGFSQDTLPSEAHVSRRMIGCIESGTRVPTVEMEDRIAHALRLKSSELLALAEG